MLYSLKIIIKFILLAVFITGSIAYSQKVQKKEELFNPNKKFSISLYSTYISSSQLQNDAKSTDPIERNATIPLSGGFGYGAELNYKPSQWKADITFFLSTEFFKVTQRDLYLRFEQGNSSANVAMKESFRMIPLEMGLKWDLPVSSNNFKIYIGGGGGLYFGDRTRTIGTSVESYTTFKKPGFSLNVLTGIEYYLERNLSADFEFKFREGSFDVESSFHQNLITVNGVDYILQNPTYSRIIVDGVRLSLGLRYNF